MTEDLHPIDDAVRRLAGDPRPSDEERLRARVLLDTLIVEASKQRNTRRRVILSVGVVAVSVIVVFSILLFRPTATEAAAEEMATAAEAVDPLTLPANSYLYTRAETTALSFIPADGLNGVDYDKDYLIYEMSSERQTWIAADGTTQIATKNLAPHFFTSADEDVYYAAHLDMFDAIGQTQTAAYPPPDQVEEWPTQIDDLATAIREAISQNGRSDSMEYLDAAIDIIRERPVDPETRANVLRLIGHLPDLEIVDSDDNRTTFQIRYERNGSTETYKFTLTSHGELAFEQRTLVNPNPSLALPAGTVASSASYSPGEVVPDLSNPDG